ncbi:liver carboxylesterase B-1-like [Saccostrea echinata]|uniref:liver carboxylesterase B-1-like n=1 Tax=Saccostrea echinata TaxID=191078 RepID=UPI002A818B2F|nr:liver carboxylesterase B-1-like [Saccostrea echinata]
MKSISFGICLVMFAFGSDVINVVEVKTPSGWVRGYEELYNETQVYRFIKIPYAEPPIGNLRFKKTQPIGEWKGVEGVRDVNAPQCSQIEDRYPGFDTLVTDEDCLYLNIYVPGKISEDRNLSVMVWIHGSGFMFGGASQYKPQKLVLGGDVIVVTINYRLGLLGFMTLHDPLAPGNYGLWDQIEALRWVQNNIAAFGGNPKSVTIFGNAAGGISVSLQTLIPSNKGLFQRAISQSGVVSLFCFPTKREEKQTNDLVLKKTNCECKGDIAETLKCLRDLPVENLTATIKLLEFQSPLNVSFVLGSMGPTIDGDLIKDNLAYPKSWDDDVYSFFRSIDFMSGTLDGEGILVYSMLSQEIQERFNLNISERVPVSILCESFAPSYVNTVAGNFPELTQEICELYTTPDGDDEQSRRVTDFQSDSLFIVPSNIMLGIHAKNNSQAKTFQYLITKPTPFPFFQEPPSWFKGAGHGEDLHLLFGVTSDHVSEETLKKHDLGAVERLSKNVINYWAIFTKNGDPNSEGLPNWPSFNTLSKEYAILDTPIAEGENLKANATVLLKKVISKGNFTFNNVKDKNSLCSSHSLNVRLDKIN